MNEDIIKEVANRTKGEIYLGVVGAVRSGKSTFIDNHKLRDYTVSSDNLRQLLGSNELQVDGTFGINQNVSKAMWGLLYDVLERRFQQGAFTVLDSTNIKTADMQKVNK